MRRKGPLFPPLIVSFIVAVVFDVIALSITENFGLSGALSSIGGGYLVGALSLIVWRIVFVILDAF